MDFRDKTINFSSSKIKLEKFLIQTINQLKKNSKTVGLCVGSYDLLHPGHMKHFESAKSLCDALVVGVTSDVFVRKRKGNNRPVICENLRAYSISQLSSVDYVIISPFERATDLIYSLKPSYYIKGSDYKNKNTPGITAERKAIKEAGGEIRYTHDEKFSTTDLISRIQKKTDKPVLIIGGGIEGAGQSTLLKAFAKKNDFIYINKDDIDSSCLTSMKNMFMIVKNNLNLGFNVVLDGYFSEKSSIPFIKEEITNISKKNDVVKIYFKCSKKTIIDRLKQRKVEKNKLKEFDEHYEKNKDMNLSFFDIIFNTKGDILVNVDSLSHEIMNKINKD